MNTTNATNTTQSPLIPTHEEIQTFFLTQTPDQIRATADTRWPDTGRPKCPILARHFDAQKQHYIAKRTEIEKELAALLAFAKFLALENNTPLRPLLETGEARVAYAQHRDALQPPRYLTEPEIQEALAQFGPKPSRDADLWQTRRHDFLKFYRQRLLTHQIALATQKRFSEGRVTRVPDSSLNEKCKMLNDQCSMTSQPRASVMDCGAGAPLSDEPQNTLKTPPHQPVHEPVQNPVQPTQPLPSQSSSPSASSAVNSFPSSSSQQNHLDPDSPLGKFRAAITTFKEAIATLDQNGNPATVQQNLFQLLTPVLQLVQSQSDPSPAEPHSSQSSQASQKSPSPTPSDYDRLSQQITASLKKPRSKLDQLPADQQEILFDLLHEHDARNICPVVEREWNLTTSASALNAFKTRYQAKLDAAEQQKLQTELNNLATKESPDYTQAAEKILQQRAIQITRDKKSTPDQIYKIFTALTRYTNAQTSKARLAFQIQKSSSGGHTAPISTPAQPAHPVHPVETRTSTAPSAPSP